MRLVNTTNVAARMIVSRGPRADERIGVIAAKATFSLEGPGAPQLDTRAARAVLDADEPTDLGVLPADLQPRRQPWFEVIVLGRAYVSNGSSSIATTVELSVDDRVRRIRVIGDRRWASQGRDVAGTPTEFTSMPLVWERAFGGRCAVHVDRSAVVDVFDPLNSLGRGFDPRPQAEALARLLRAPPGFPVVDDPGLLANLEDPQAPLVPQCWATVPRGIGVGMQELTGVDASLDPITRTMDRVALRAHPDWILAPPRAPPVVRLSGMRADGGSLAFTVPRVRVTADGTFGGRRSTLGLRPETLVLLPEDNRFYVVYRAAFRLAKIHAVGRALRLRVDEGWSVPGAQES